MKGKKRSRAFNKAVYRRNINKLSLKELRDALVREAELRHNATLALNDIMDRATKWPYAPKE
jgi:hypothetical protein